MSACRVCSCTDDDCGGCVERTGAPCWWVERDLCSACAPDQVAAGRVLAISSARRLAEAQVLSGVIVLLLDRHGNLQVGACLEDAPASEPLRLVGELVDRSLRELFAGGGDDAT